MANRGIQQSLELALQRHRAGQLAQAEQIYHQILAIDSDHPDALHLLGVIAVQVGRSDTAIDLIRRALVLRPHDAGMRSNLGNALKLAGRFDEAIAAYRDALVADPAHAGAHSNVGCLLVDQGKLDEAILAFQQAIAIAPGLLEAHLSLGNALREKGMLQESIAACRTALALSPTCAEAWCNLGNALDEQGARDQAIDAYRRAIAYLPTLPEAHSNLSRCLLKRGELTEAMAAARRAVELKPEYARAHCHLGMALIDSGRLGEGIDSYRRSLALKPDLPEAHLNLGIALLLRGDFAEGWEQYDWRKRFFPNLYRGTKPSQWDGRPFHDRVLLLSAEQGLGDTLQFIRYLPLVARHGGRVILECPPELLRLLEPLADTCKFVPTGQPVPHFDLCCPLLSLPRIFNTRLDDLPRHVPYLHPQPADVAAWGERLGREHGQRQPLHIGLVWAGNPGHPNDRRRSIPLTRLARLADVPDVRWISLQKGPAAAQIQSPPPRLRILDLADALHDLADTAALIANLDLVVGVDTSVIHLAGAMAKPVWTLLPFVPDWRWLLERDDTPWYPTMRLFRQPARDDWDTPIARVADALRAGAGAG